MNHKNALFTIGIISAGKRKVFSSDGNKANRYRLLYRMGYRHTQFFSKRIFYQRQNGTITMVDFETIKHKFLDGIRSGDLLGGYTADEAKLIQDYCERNLIISRNCRMLRAELNEPMTHSEAKLFDLDFKKQIIR